MLKNLKIKLDRFSRSFKNAWKELKKEETTAKKCIESVRDLLKYYDYMQDVTDKTNQYLQIIRTGMKDSTGTYVDLDMVCNFLTYHVVPELKREPFEKNEKIICEWIYLGDKGKGLPYTGMKGIYSFIASGLRPSLKDMHEMERLKQWTNIIETYNKTIARFNKDLDKFGLRTPYEYPENIQINDKNNDD